MSFTCGMCGGTREPGQTTFTADLGTGVVVIRGVPATICDQCGEEWLDDATAAKVESLTREARQRHALVEVWSLGA